MRFIWGGISLVAFFMAIGLAILAVVQGTNAILMVILAFVALLTSYFSRQMARRFD